MGNSPEKGGLDIGTLMTAQNRAKLVDETKEQGQLPKEELSLPDDWWEFDPNTNKLSLVEKKFLEKRDPKRLEMYKKQYEVLKNKGFNDGDIFGWTDRYPAMRPIPPSRMFRSPDKDVEG